MSTRRYAPQIPQAVTANFVADGQGPADPGAAAVPRCCQPYRDRLGAAGGLRLDAVPGPAALLAGAWREAGYRQSGRDGVPTKSAALIQCASDLVELADAVYVIDLTVRRALSVWELANTFAAFRWGGLLQVHAISAMEFPYSVAGLTSQHLKMRWSGINDPRAPDKPGTRFRLPFGAVPAVLSLGYLAVA